MAGYSGTPLPKKLGIKENHRVALLQKPVDFELVPSEVPGGVCFAGDGKGPPLDVIVFFTKNLAELRKEFTKLSARLTPAGGLWIAWPKKVSGIPTDLTEDIIREVGLAAGLVDNKVCAVDDVWSGLRFVVRVKDRTKKAPPARGRRS